MAECALAAGCALFPGRGVGGAAHTRQRSRCRGELARLLRDCAATLDDELQALLQITYFPRNPAHDNVALALAMNISDRTFYRTRILAIKALARALHTAVVSSVRMERPVAGLTVGRDTLLTHAQLLLKAGRSLSTWFDRIGKSTLPPPWLKSGRPTAQDIHSGIHYATAPMTTPQACILPWPGFCKQSAQAIPGGSLWLTAPLATLNAR